MELGAVPLGYRRVIPIVGGRISGPLMDAEIIEGGADWQIVAPDGTAVIDTRYSARTPSGHHLYLQTAGFRHGPAEVLARVASGEGSRPQRVLLSASRPASRRVTPGSSGSIARCSWPRRAATRTPSSTTCSRSADASGEGRRLTSTGSGRLGPAVPPAADLVRRTARKDHLGGCAVRCVQGEHERLVGEVPLDVDPAESRVERAVRSGDAATRLRREPKPAVAGLGRCDPGRVPVEERDDGALAVVVQDSCGMPSASTPSHRSQTVVAPRSIMHIHPGAFGWSSSS